jgi:alkylation response protein AidB-like acyl-CoA dehydrogenase
MTKENSQKPMVDFSWTPEQVDWKLRVIEHAQSELGHNLCDRDRQQGFDWDGWQALGKLGLTGLPISAQYGGGDGDPLTTLLALEGLGYGCRDNGLNFALNAHLWGCAMPLARFGNEAQKRCYLPRLACGEWMGALAASEREAGSDVYSSQTTAICQGDDYLLNGSKMFVTNAPIANLFLVLATIDSGKGPFGLTAFLLEKGTPGLYVGENLEKMGLRSTPMGELFLKDCIVPAANRLGAEGNGMAIFSDTMEWERSFILACAVGAMQRVLEQCVRYVQQRRQFGQAIGKFQAIAHKVVEMRLRLETARLLLYKVGWLKQQNAPALEEAAMAKLYISEAWVQNCQDALQVHGGYGYLTETGLERELRDAIGSQFYSGTAEIQRQTIARLMNL